MRSGLFDHLVVEFDHRLAENLQDGGATVRQVVVPSAPFSISHSGLRTQPPIALQTLQERIERPRADVVAVASQLGEHPLTDDRMLGRVMKDMDLPEAQQDLACEQL